jgi:hypothetical protein
MIVTAVIAIALDENCYLNKNDINLICTQQRK